MGNTHRVTTTDAAIDAAIERGQRHPVSHATRATYDPTRDAVVVRVVLPGTRAPVSMAFDRRRIQGLEGASRAQLSGVRLEGGGTGLVWPALDVAHYLPALLADLFGTARWMAAERGRAGGQATTPAKVRAARLNGAKGGRPRATHAQDHARTTDSHDHARPPAAHAKRARTPRGRTSR